MKIKPYEMPTVKILCSQVEEPLSTSPGDFGVDPGESNPDGAGAGGL